MRTFKKIIVAVVVNLIVIEVLFFLLNQPSLMKIMLHQYEEGEYNAVILGQSQAETGLDPYALSSTGQDKVYNLAYRYMVPEEILYLLKQVNEIRKPEKVFLELDYLYWGEQSATPGTDTIMLRKLNGKNIPDYFFREALASSWTEPLFDYRLDSGSWAQVPIRLRLAKDPKFCQDLHNGSDDAILRIYKEYHLWDGYKYYGDGFVYGVTIDEKEEYVPPQFQGICQSAEKAFGQIADYCHENDIELFAIVMGVPPANCPYLNIEPIHDAFRKLCDQYGVTLIDVNYIKEEFLSLSDNDYQDIYGHMMGASAEKLSLVLKDILASDHPEEYLESEFSSTAACQIYQSANH